GDQASVISCRFESGHQCGGRTAYHEGAARLPICHPGELLEEASFFFGSMQRRNRPALYEFVATADQDHRPVFERRQASGSLSWCQRDPVVEGTDAGLFSNKLQPMSDALELD